MPDMPRFMRGLPARLKTMGLRAGVSASLSLGAVAFAQLHSATVAPVQPPSATSSHAGSSAYQDVFKVELPAPSERLAVDIEAAAPRPKARPKSATATANAAKPAEAAALPLGVERFDRCRTACDTRDPVIMASWSPVPAAPPHAPAAAPGLPQPAARASAHRAPLDGAVSLVADSGRYVIDGGRQVIDGALSTAGTAFDGAKSAMIEVLGPRR